MPPAEWPQVALGGRSYTVKYGMLSSYELSKAGTDPADAIRLVQNADDHKNFARILDVWRACTAHEFKLANPPQPIPSVEWWISAIESDPVPQDKINEIGTALGRAIVKWLLAQPTKAAAAPAETPAAETPTQTPTPQAVN